MMDLSETGKLYLESYTILEEARQNMENYLNDILDNIEKQLEEDIKSQDKSVDRFKLELYNNQTNRGQISLDFRRIDQHAIFRKGKTDLYIKYEDFRINRELKDGQVKISLKSPNISKSVEDIINKKGKELLNTDLYNPIIIDIKNKDNAYEEIYEIIDELYNNVLSIIENLELR